MAPGVPPVLKTGVSSNLSGAHKCNKKQSVCVKKKKIIMLLYYHYMIIRKRPPKNGGSLLREDSLGTCGSNVGTLACV